MNHSIYTADRATHLKIVVAALVAAIAMTGIVLSFHAGPDAGAIAVVQAAKPVALSSAAAVIR